jgi:acetyl coenzyme A synthetase (ADP forming)-like protein
MSDISAFFTPKGVAVIGASSKPNKLSYGILENLSKYGYKGAIYPINPNSDQILDLKCYDDVREVPDPVELGVIVLPAGMTLEAVQACAERGIKAVIIISGGFREVGEGGRALETACLQVARENDMRIIGPNCVGTMDMNNGLDSTFIKGMPEAGPIGFVSQSGAVCGGVVDLLIDKHIGFSHFASLGNELDVSEADIIEYYGNDPNVKVIAAYIEGVQNGPRFMDISKKVSQIKPIVLLKAGKSDAGARAVSSHTGSLAGSYEAYKAAFKQTGIIEVENIKDLFNVAMAFGAVELPKGNRVAIVTNAGGPAALASDSLAAHGSQLAIISEETQALLKPKLNPSAQVGNPIDILGAADPNEYDICLAGLNADEGVDVLLPILVPQSLVDPVEVAKSFIKNAHSNKPLISCMMGDRSVNEARELLHHNKVPMFQYPEDVGPVLGAFYQYQKFISQNRVIDPSYTNLRVDDVRDILELSLGKKSLGEAGTRPILEAYGIPIVPGGFAEDAKNAVKIAKAIGFPVAMKIVSDDILHKSDAGGIKLNLQNEKDVTQAFTDMMSNINLSQPNAKIEGVLVEKMMGKGHEVIVGMQRDKTFGPMIMFGMGGIYVELIKDVSFCIAPVTKSDILSAINETYAGKLLKGFRGMPTGDVEAVIDVIGRIAQLSLDHPELIEFEINPLVVYEIGKGVASLDSRAILREKSI